MQNEHHFSLRRQRGILPPLIDFSQFLLGDSASRLRAADAITSGFKSSGFIYLANYGISPLLISAVFSSSRSFFSSPQSTKDALALKGATTNRGYGPQGREKLIHVTSAESDAIAFWSSAPDLKETFRIGVEDGNANQWPEDENFKQVMLDFWDGGKRLHEQVMSAIALGLGLEEGFFMRYIDKGQNSLRRLYRNSPFVLACQATN